MRRNTGFRVCIVVLFTVCNVAFASDSENLDGAHRVVVGQVVNIYHQDEEAKWGVITRYVLELKVEKSEKGEGVQPGQVLYAHNWQITKVTNIGEVPVAPPRPANPKKGDVVRLFLVRDSEGRHRIMYNSNAIKPVSQKAK